MGDLGFWKSWWKYGWPGSLGGIGLVHLAFAGEWVGVALLTPPIIVMAYRLDIHWQEQMGL